MGPWEPRAGHDSAWLRRSKVRRRPALFGRMTSPLLVPRRQAEKQGSRLWPQARGSGVRRGGAPNTGVCSGCLSNETQVGQGHWTPRGFASAEDGGWTAERPRSLSGGPGRGATQATPLLPELTTCGGWGPGRSWEQPLLRQPRPPPAPRPGSLAGPRGGRRGAPARAPACADPTPRSARALRASAPGVARSA